MSIISEALNPTEKYHFFLNGVRYESPSVLPTLAGWQIREIAKVPADYTIKHHLGLNNGIVVGCNNAVNLDVDPAPELYMVPGAV